MQERERSRASASTINENRKVSGTAIEPHASVAFAGDDAEAVVLDLVQPRVPVGGCCAFVGRQGARAEREHGRAIRCCGGSCHRLWDEMRQNQTQHRSKRNAVAQLFDYLVGAGEQARRNFEVEYPGGFGVDD